MRLWLWSRTAWALAFFPRSSCVAVEFDVAVRPLEGHPHRQINAIYRTADVSLAAVRFLEYLFKRVRAIAHFGQISESGAFSYEIELSNEVPRYTAA